MNDPLIDAVRDGLAAPFAEAIALRIPAVVEVLEQQLMQEENRDLWKPLKAAITALKDQEATLGGRAMDAVKKRFDNKRTPGADTFGQTARFSLDSLSLVADSEMQEEIVLGNATRRLKEQSDEELFALTQRLASLMGRDNLPDENNPAFPRIFARGLFDALSQPGVEPASRIAAFSAFGPVMLEVVPQAYATVNKMLRERGVMPDFRRAFGAPVNPELRARPAGAASAGTGGSSTSGGSSGSDAGSDSPASRFEQLISGAATRASTPAPVAATPGMVTIQVRPELVAALRALESRMPEGGAGSADAPPAPAGMGAGAAGGMGAGTTAGAGRVIRHEAVSPEAGGDSFIAAEPLYPVVIPRIKREMGSALTPADAVVADIVAALFERLFADGRLADAFKAQVGRLQLPVFKAVMQDRHFFTDKAHPIRMLIDVMAQLGVAEDEVKVDGRTPEQWVAASVERLVVEHADDTSAFERTARHLAEILERHREAALEVDKAVVELRRQEVRFAAVREASLAIAHRLSAGNYTREVSEFLYRAWRDVMMCDYLAEGDDSADWKADLETLDDILWIMTPRSSLPERERIVSLLPSLAFRVRLGHVRAGMDGDRSAALIEEMKEMHASLARSPAAAAHGHAMRKARMEATVPASLDDYTATLHVSSASLAEEGLSRGAWFEFVEPDGTRRRCRLTWMSPVQGTCLFKDLEHNRSFAISLAEVRDRRRAGTAMPVDGPGVAQASIEGAIEDVAKSLVP
ncbi:hypothetical protein BWI17_15255 [Betaproteobacteria bacterium GR16-43]|nr:hypothetical protein BWI17_15255 [Betaproteobacteria bacterium GR16-43]